MDDSVAASRIPPDRIHFPRPRTNEVVRSRTTPTTRTTARRTSSRWECQLNRHHRGSGDRQGAKQTAHAPPRPPRAGNHRQGRHLRRVPDAGRSPRKRQKHPLQAPRARQENGKNVPFLKKSQLEVATTAKRRWDPSQRRSQCRSLQRPQWTR